MGGRGKKRKFGEGQIPYFWFKVKVEKISHLTGKTSFEVFKTGQYGEIQGTGFEVNEWGTKTWHVSLLNGKTLFYWYIFGEARDYILDLTDITSVTVYDIYLEHIHDTKKNKVIYIDKNAKDK